MAIGFNSEVMHGSIKYHVQTENMSPKAEIVSHVYRAGTILFTKRTSYAQEEQKPSFVDELAAKQHRVILGIIQRGGIELLRSYAGEPTSNISDTKRADPIPLSRASQAPRIKSPDASPSTPAKAREEKLVLELLAPKEFYEGCKEVLKVQARTDVTKKPLAGINIMVKILGISIRPIIFTGKTDAEGLYSLDLSFPASVIGPATLEISGMFGLGSRALKFEIKKR